LLLDHAGFGKEEALSKAGQWLFDAAAGGDRVCRRQAGCHGHADQPERTQHAVDKLDGSTAGDRTSRVRFARREQSSEAHLAWILDSGDSDRRAVTGLGKETDY